MKKLTQAIFDGAPWWAKSAAISAQGEAHIYGTAAKNLSRDDYLSCFLPHHYAGYMEFVGFDYDPTDWQNSAIDREVSK